MNFWNYKRKQKIQISGAQCWTALWPGFRPSAWPSGLAGMTNTVRSSRARWQTRCSEGGGASTMGAVATSLIRLWRWVDGEGGGRRQLWRWRSSDGELLRWRQRHPGAPRSEPGRVRPSLEETDEGGGGAHRGWEVVVAATSIPGGVATVPVARVDRRQEGGKGARLCSRRDADGGESEKGRDGGRRLLSARRAVGEGGAASVWKREMDREKGALARRVGGAHAHDTTPSRGGRALTSGPRLQCRWVKFNSNPNSN
jgi:hypothetical protein